MSGVPCYRLSLGDRYQFRNEAHGTWNILVLKYVYRQVDVVQYDWDKKRGGTFTAYESYMYNVYAYVESRCHVIMMRSAYRSN